MVIVKIIVRIMKFILEIIHIAIPYKDRILLMALKNMLNLNFNIKDKIEDYKIGKRSNIYMLIIL